MSSTVCTSSSGRAFELGIEAYDFAAGQHFRKRDLLGQIGNRTPRSIAARVIAGNRYRSGGWLDEPQNETEQRGLARTIVTEQRHLFAGSDVD